MFSKWVWTYFTPHQNINSAGGIINFDDLEEELVRVVDSEFGWKIQTLNGKTYNPNWILLERENFGKEFSSIHEVAEALKGGSYTVGTF